MTYWLDVFSPLGWKESKQKGISGFSECRRNLLKNIKRDDILICYMNKKSVWCGALQVTSSCPYYCNTPIYSENRNKTHYPHRINVRLLLTKNGIDVRDTKYKLKLFERNPENWWSFLRTSPRELDDEDGELILKMLREGGQGDRSPDKNQKRNEVPE